MNLTSHPLSRRRFLLASAGVCATATGLHAGVANSTLHKATKQARALGAKVSITALGSDPTATEAAIHAAFQELERVESLMSIYRPDSELSRLNRDGILRNPDPRLRKVLNFAKRLSAQTRGAFDVTVQPLWELCQSAKRNEVPPSADEIAEARSKVDWRQLEISKDAVCLHKKGASVTLNGIAQGYAADLAGTALARRGITQALIDTGEFRSLGSNTNDKDWSVGIQHPRNVDALISIARLNGRCIATSGDYQTTFTDNFRRHHIFDPHTGTSPAELASVSVVAPEAMTADALSTAIFVLGPEKGARLARAHHGVEAFLVLKNGRTMATDGFPLKS